MPGNITTGWNLQLSTLLTLPGEVEHAWVSGKVHPLYKPGYAIPCVTDWAVSRKRIVKHVPKRSRIGAHRYATVLVLWVTARSVTLTVETRYPRQRIVQSTATEGSNKINCWDWCRIFGRLKGYVKRQKSGRRRRKGKSQNWESKIWSRDLRDSDLRKTALARTSSIYKRQTRPLVREGTPQKQDPNCQTIINTWPWAPDGARHQDLLTDRPSVAM
jgi:hypothetical protein